MRDTRITKNEVDDGENEGFLSELDGGDDDPVFEVDWYDFFFFSFFN